MRAGLASQLAEVEHPRVMVTSPSAGEGKTFTCVGLARCCAKAGQRVLVVDSDLRHPDAHRLLGAHNDFGLSDLLLERRSPDQCIQTLPPDGTDSEWGQLLFVGTGPVTAQPAELLSRERAGALLAQLADLAAITFFDTPPVLGLADALIVGQRVSGAVLVVHAKRTKLPDLQRAKQLLLRNQTTVFGAVLNKFDRSDGGDWPVASPTNA